MRCWVYGVGGFGIQLVFRAQDLGVRGLSVWAYDYRCFLGLALAAEARCLCGFGYCRILGFEFVACKNHSSKTPRLDGLPTASSLDHKP